MYKKTVLKNGIRLVTESFSNVRSVSVGIWVGVGSIYENPQNNGIAHFIEHMLFKGTPTMNAKQLAESIDNLGGQINAFTGKEATCYYVKVLDEHLESALKVLADLFCNSKLADEDIDLERKVIHEEIMMNEDTPEDLVHDLLVSNVYKDNGFGLPILGTLDSLNSIDRGQMLEFIDRRYSNSQIVISAAGSFDQEELEGLVESYFGHRVQNEVVEKVKTQTNFNRKIQIKERDTEQVHVCIGFNSVNYLSPLSYTVILVNTILGGGMSSRLFQSIREERGLVYSIYSYPTSTHDSGMFTIYAGMNPTHLDEVLSLVSKEVELLKSEGVTPELVEKAKNQIKGNFILGQETPSSRMNTNGRSELLKGRIQTQDEFLASIDGITQEEILEVLDIIFGSKKYCGSAIGPVSKINHTGLF